MKLLFAVFTLFVSTSLFSADLLVLNNSMKFEGRILKIKNCDIVFEGSDKMRYTIPATDIAYVKFQDIENPIYKEYLKISSDNSDLCLAGRLDAENYHGKAGMHIALGVLFGPFAVLGAAVAKPIPQTGQNTPIMSENQGLFNDPSYLSCYTKKARGQNVGNAFLGWGAWLLLIIVLNS